MRGPPATSEPSFYSEPLPVKRRVVLVAGVDLISEIVEANPRMRRTVGHALDWMYFNDIAAIAMTLRRELAQQKTANLRYLLHEMEEQQPQVMTTAGYRALWLENKPRDRFWGPDRDFDCHQLAPHPPDPERDHID